MHTLGITPLRSESPPQKRSDMARVLKGFHGFTCTPTRSSAIGMSHTCLCLFSYSWYSFTDPGGMEGWLALVRSNRGRDSIENPALYHTATSAHTFTDTMLMFQWLPKIVMVLASGKYRNAGVGACSTRAGSGVVRMDPLRFLAGCRTRRLNQV